METIKSRVHDDIDAKYLSIGPQVVLIAYAIKSFFLSIECLCYLYYAAEKASQANKGNASLAPGYWKPMENDFPQPDGILWPAYRSSARATALIESP
jgi:hypothetical protein